MILDGEEVKDKESVVFYVQKLISSNLEIPYYGLHRLLDLHKINIESIVFEDSKKSVLSVLEVSDLKGESVDLHVSEKSWIEYLPSIYKDNKELKSFLYGIQVSMFKQRFIVDHIEDIFMPRKGDFLDWLASWYGVGFSSSVKNDTKRELIYKLLDLYKKRGTVEYLIEMVKILTAVNIEIKERAIPQYLQKNDDFMVEKYNLKITFTVKILDDDFNSQEDEKLVIRSIRNIIEREKPAFTEYFIDSNFIRTESKSIGVDMKKEEVKEELFIVEEEAKVDHFQHEKEEEKQSVEEKKKDDLDDDFFSYN